MIAVIKNAMSAAAFVLLMLIAGASVHAQPQEASPDVPDSVRARVFALQRDASSMQGELNKLEAQYNKIHEQWILVQLQLKQELDAVKPPEGYALDPQSMSFVKK